MGEGRLLCRAGHIPAQGFLFSPATGGQSHLLRGGAPLEELGRHLRKGPRFKVGFTESCRESRTPKGLWASGAVLRPS